METDFLPFPSSFHWSCRCRPQHTEGSPGVSAPGLEANKQAVKAELTYDQKKDSSSIIHYRVEFGNVLLLHCPFWKWVKVLNQRRSDCRGKETLPHGLPAADASWTVGCCRREGTLLLSPLAVPLVWWGRSLE